MKISIFNPKWILPSKIDDNLLIWTVSINGIAMDIHNAPRYMQEREALNIMKIEVNDLDW